MNTKDVFAPAELGRGKIKIKNRVFMAPMTNCQSFENGMVHDNEIKFHALRAKGGFAGAMTACSHVRADAKSYPGELGCFEDEQINGLNRLSDSWRNEGGVAILQLFHGGLRAPSKLTGQQPRAPSVVQQDFPGFEEPRSLNDKEILEIITDFKSAALRAKKAGFVGIEIHAANGYLFSQFLSTITNQREDHWGAGNIENRARFLTEVVREIREACASPFIVGVKLPPEDTPAQRGFDIDEMTHVAALLSKLGVDYIHISSQGVRSVPWKYPNSPQTILRRMREAVSPDVQIIACGNIKTADDASFALNEGADLVSLARTSLAAPDWPLHATDQQWKFNALPLSETELNARGISKNFVEYLRTMKMVEEEQRSTI